MMVLARALLGRRLRNGKTVARGAHPSAPTATPGERKLSLPVSGTSTGGSCRCTGRYPVVAPEYSSRPLSYTAGCERPSCRSLAGPGVPHAHKRPATLGQGSGLRATWSPRRTGRAGESDGTLLKIRKTKGRSLSGGSVPPDRPNMIKGPGVWRGRKDPAREAKQNF